MAPERLTGASDNDLARAAAGGNRRALEILLERHFDYVHAVCRRVTGHSEDALDATQEALISVSRRISSFDGRSLFTTWLYRVATNAALDEVRRRKRRPTPSDTSFDTGPIPGDATVSSPESAVNARIDIDAALARIPEEFRTAVVLRDLADLDYAEIAEALDIPIGTVRSRIARGRQALAAILGNSPTTPDVQATDTPR